MRNHEHDCHKFLLHDWGNYSDFSTTTILDTTLRDGIQSLLKRYPTLDEKLHLVDLLIEVGVKAFDIGFPISNTKHKHHTIKLAEHIAQRDPTIRLTCLSRSVIEDVQAIIEVSQASGAEIEALIFVGSSPVRQLVEQWDVQKMVDWTTKAINFAIKNGLKVNFACEDATRSEPETLHTLYSTALACGATRLTIPDTVGICNVISTTRIINFFHQSIIQGQLIGLDWHGHDDRGLAVANALAAIAAGADCIHTTVLGIGERCGNVPFETILANLSSLNGNCYRLDLLPKLSEYTTAIVGECISVRHPIVGRNAFSTAAGIHGAAILKAMRSGHPELIANVYAGIDPRVSNRKVEVQVGPLSGTANVEWKASQLGISFSQSFAEQVLKMAYETDRILSDEEILSIAHLEANNNDGKRSRNGFHS